MGGYWRTPQTSLRERNSTTPSWHLVTQNRQKENNETKQTQENKVEERTKPKRMQNKIKQFYLNREKKDT